MKVLITGGLGYIGGRIAQEISKHATVFITTRKTRKDIEKVQLPKNFEILTEIETYDGEFISKLTNIDVVIHLAAMNEVDCVKNPTLATEVNVLQSFKLLNACIANKVKRFIYFSTAHVYASPLSGGINEALLTRPTHPYAVTHRAFEDFVTAALDTRSIEGVVIRLSNSFGPPAFNTADRWTLLVNDLCKQAIERNELVLKTSGLQQRDFITLTDVGLAVEHFINMPISLIGDGVFNLGGNNAMSVKNMAQLVQERASKITGKKIPLVIPTANEKELTQDNYLDFQINKLRNTGFNLSGNMLEEIDATLRYCISSN